MVPTNTKQLINEMEIILKYSTGEAWMIKEGKTMYMQKMKGLRPDEAADYDIGKWAHELIWSVAKSNCDLPDGFKIKKPK